MSSQIIINKTANLDMTPGRRAQFVRVPLGLQRTPRNGFEFADMPRNHAEPVYPIHEYAAMLDYLIDCADAVSVSNGSTVRRALIETLDSEACQGWRVLPRHIDHVENFVVNRVHREKSEVEKIATVLREADARYTVECENGNGGEFNIPRYFVALDRKEIENCGYGYDGRIKAQARIATLNKGQA